MRGRALNETGLQPFERFGLFSAVLLAVVLAFVVTARVGAVHDDTVAFHADYESFDSLAELEDAADLVVVGRVTDQGETVLVYPETTDSTDPTLNPLAGVDGSLEQPETPPIVTTVHEVAVTRTIWGDLKDGEVVRVRELGGEYGNVTYVSESPALAQRSMYLMFLVETEPGVYVLLNPDEAKFPVSSEGKLTKLPTNESPITSEELAAYVG